MSKEELGLIALIIAAIFLATAILLYRIFVIKPVRHEQIKEKEAAGEYEDIDRFIEDALRG